MLEVGSDAPDISLPNQDGDIVELSTFRGQHVVVYFYPRADTSGCTTEACGFRDQWDQFEGSQVQVLGISDDPVSDLAKFADKYDLPFELLSDESGEVAAAYESYGEKQSFGNTYDGVFRNTYIVDPSGKIVEAYEGVSPDGHAEAVLADIEAALA